MHPLMISNRSLNRCEIHIWRLQGNDHLYILTKTSCLQWRNQNIDLQKLLTKSNYERKFQQFIEHKIFIAKQTSSLLQKCYSIYRWISSNSKPFVQYNRFLIGAAFLISTCVSLYSIKTTIKIKFLYEQIFI